ncbi:MAG: hypothetical protein ACLP9K_02160 [Nitrososphaerales archaeon]
MEANSRQSVIIACLASAFVALLVIGAAVTYFPIDSGATGEQTSDQGSLNTTQSFSLAPCNAVCVVSPPWQVFQSIGELKQASELILIAQVASVSTSAGPGGYPVTRYNLTIIRVLVGNSNLTVGGSVSMAQIGGSTQDVTVRVKGYPTLSQGNSYLFFLSAPGSFLSPYYGTDFISVGGPQGTFIVQNGNVYSLDTIYPQEDAWLGIKASGTPLSQFIAEVQIG